MIEPDPHLCGRGGDTMADARLGMVWMRMGIRWETGQPDE